MPTLGLHIPILQSTCMAHFKSGALLLSFDLQFDHRQFLMNLVDLVLKEPPLFFIVVDLLSYSNLENIPATENYRWELILEIFADKSIKYAGHFQKWIIRFVLALDFVDKYYLIS